MRIDIWIGGLKWDLYSDTNIKQTLQVNDIAQVKDRQASFTNAFTSPKTPNNIQIANGLGISSDTSRFPYEKRSCQIKIEGFDLVTKGWVNITETDDEYKIFVYSGIVQFFKAIENKTIGNDLDLSEINHEKTISVVKASQLNPFFKYLIADYNGKTHYGVDDSIVNIDYLVPSANIKYLWDKIFETFGFAYTGNLFSSVDFTNLWITYPKGIIDTDLTLIENRASSISYSQSSPYMNGVGEFGSHFLIVQSGKYQFDLDFTLNGISNVTLSGNPLKVQIWRNSVMEYEYKAFNTGTHNASALINYNTNDDLYFRWEWPQPGDYSLTIDYDFTTSIFNNANYSFNEELKDYSIPDFIKEILNRFALTPFPDEFSNVIEFKTLDERINSEIIIDWSDKYIQRLGETYLFDDYAKENTFTYQYPDKESNHFNGSIFIDNENLNESKNVFPSKTYAPEKEFAPFKLGLDSVNVLTYKIYDKDIKEVNGTQEINYKGLDKRYHFIIATPGINSFEIGSELLGESESASNFFIGEYSNQDWKSILINYYSGFKRLLNDSRIHTIDLDLNITDVISSDFAALYYFAQEQQYYILNKLPFDEKSSKGEFIRVLRYSDTVVPEEPTDDPRLSISWLDGLTFPLMGTASTIDMKISENYSPIANPILSVEWQKLVFSWTDLGSGVTPYSVSLVDGVNRFRLKGNLTVGNIYSNELQYTKTTLPPCLSFQFAYSGSAPGQNGTVYHKDCDGITRITTLTWEESDGNYYEIEICATEITSIDGSVIDITNYADQQNC